MYDYSEKRGLEVTFGVTKSKLNLTETKGNILLLRLAKIVKLRQTDGMNFVVAILAHK